MWLIARRTTATLLVIGLVSCCAYLLWKLLSDPKTYFVHLTATRYTPSGGQPLRCAYGDFDAFQQLGLAVEKDLFPDKLERPLTGKRLRAKLEAIKDLDFGRNDRLIVYLAAHGVIRDGKPQLRLEPDNWNGQEEFIPVREVLEALQQSAASTKLLILDAGQDNFNPRTGIGFNAFPSALYELLSDSESDFELNDHSMWILCANSSLERSHIAPPHASSKSRGRSVFGRFVSEGLWGRADVDGNRIVRLDELYEYVQPNVSAWVNATTGEAESQTPLLLNCRRTDETMAASELKAMAAIDLLSIRALPSVEELEASTEASESSPILRETAMEAVTVNAPEEAGEALAQLGGAASGSSEPDDNSAANQPGSSNGNAASARGNTSTQGSNFREQARQQLAIAWIAAAELESAGHISPPDANAQSSSSVQDAESSAAGRVPTPSEYAPSVWRALVDRLLWYDHYCAADFPANDQFFWKEARDILRDLNRSFDAFSRIPTMAEAERLRNGNFVDKLRLARLGLLRPIPLNETTGQHVSLALVEYAAELHGAPDAPENIKKIIKFAEEYDKVLAGDEPTPEKLNQLLTPTEGENLNDIDNFYELQIKDLRRHDNVPWRLARMALRVRRDGEKAAANLLCAEGWACAAIERGDRLRMEGERLLRDQTDKDWANIAEVSLDEARKSYDQATGELAAVRDILETRQTVLSRLPDYFRWIHMGRPHTSGDMPTLDDLGKAILLLDEADKLLSQPDKSKTDDLTDLRRRLRDASDALDQGWTDVNDRWRMEAALRTALPEFGERGLLRKRLLESASDESIQFSRQPPSSAAFEASPIEERRWSKEQIEAEIELARLAGFKHVGLEPQTANEGEQSPDLADVLAVEESYCNLFISSGEPAAESVGLNDSTKRPATLVGLRSSMRNWLLRDGEERIPRELGDNNLFSLLNAASWYDLLTWQGTRFHKALDDTTLPEANTLSRFRDAYRDLANKIEGQPDLDPVAAPGLSVNVDSSEIHLVREDEKSKTLKLRIRSPIATEVWFIAEYDSRVLDVAGKGIINQEQLRSASRNRREQMDGAIYPYRPELVGAPKTVLAANKPHEVELTVARLSDEAEDTKLIVKAVSREAYKRHEVNVGLPGTASYKLEVAGEQKWKGMLWDDRYDGVVLHPLPNQPSDFAFKLLNGTDQEKTVSVRFIVPQRSGDQIGALPRGAPVPAEIDRILNEFGGKELMPSALTFKLPASGEKRIEFTPSGDQPAPANLLPPDPAAPDKPPMINLPYGLIVVIEDGETKQKTLRRIVIEPQPPRLFLSAIADVDAAGNVAIRVSATNRALIPPEGIRVSAKIEGISDQFNPKLDGIIIDPTYSAELTGRIAANAPSQLTATVDVGDYPRAFIFPISRGATRKIEPAANTRQVRIVSPQRDKSFKAAPLALVPVTLQVDAPHNAFSSGREAYVDIGIDSDRDRSLSDETPRPQRLYADRQVNVDATSFAPDGELTLDTRIGDFSLNLTGSASKEPVWVLGQLRVPELPPVSDSVEIKLDGAPPNLESIRLPSRTIEAGKDLDVIISASDLSNIVEVAAAFETSSANNAQRADPSWTPAQRSADGTWVAKLKTQDLYPNTDHYIVVKATDEVGHVAQETMGRVRVVAKPAEGEQAAGQDMRKKSADIEGIVLFKGRALPAKVEFDPPPAPPLTAVETGEDGRFTFTDVPPGKHKLHARGQKDGYYRNAWLEVEVPAEGSETPLTAILNAE